MDDHALSAAILKNILREEKEEGKDKLVHNRKQVVSVAPVKPKDPKEAAAAKKLAAEKAKQDALNAILKPKKAWDKSTKRPKSASTPRSKITSSKAETAPAPPIVKSQDCSGCQQLRKAYDHLAHRFNVMAAETAEAKEEREVVLSILRQKEESEESKRQTDVDKQISRLKEQVAVLTSESKALKHQIATNETDYRKEVTRLTKELKQQELKATKLKSEKKTVEGKTTQGSAGNTVARPKTADSTTSKKVPDYDRLVQSLTKQLQEAEEQVKKLRMSENKSSGDASQVRIKLKKMEREVGALKAKSEVDKEAWNREREEMLADMEVQCNQIDDLDAKLKKAMGDGGFRGEISKLKSEIERMEKREKLWDSERDGLKNAVMVMKQQMEVADEKRAKDAAEKRGILSRQQAADKEKELQQKTQLKEVTAQLKEQQALVFKLKKEVNILSKKQKKDAAKGAAVPDDGV